MFQSGGANYSIGQPRRGSGDGGWHVAGTPMHCGRFRRHSDESVLVPVLLSVRTGGILYVGLAIFALVLVVVTLHSTDAIAS